MIRLILTGCRWGTEQLPDGMQVNLLDEQSQIAVHVPFEGDALFALAQAAIEALPNDKKRRLAPNLTGGLILPDQDVPDDMRGPQG